MKPEDFRSELHDAIDGTPPPGLEQRVLSSVRAQGARRRAYSLPSVAVAVVMACLLVGGLAATILNLRRPSPSGSRVTPITTPAATASPDAVPSPSAPPSTAPTDAPTAAPQVVLPTSAEISPASGNVVWARVLGAYNREYLFRSEDAGGSWQQRSLPADSPGTPHISFVDAMTGWYAMFGSSNGQCSAQGVSMWRTGDAGASWQQLVPKGLVGASQCRDDISFVDAATGFVSASDPNQRPVIYGSRDGGDSWSASAALPDPPGQTTQAGATLSPRGPVRKFGADLLVEAVGWNHTYVYRSRDGGATWAYVARLPVDNFDVAFLDGSHWWIAGPPDNNVAYTADVGQHWGPLPGRPSTAAPVAPVFTFADLRIGYATVRGGIWKTSDGGAHWVTLHTPGT